jgi:hypothetical protein
VLLLTILVKYDGGKNNTIMIKKQQQKKQIKPIKKSNKKATKGTNFSHNLY